MVWSVWTELGALFRVVSAASELKVQIAQAALGADISALYLPARPWYGLFGQSEGPSSGWSLLLQIAQAAVGTDISALYLPARPWYDLFGQSEGPNSG